MSSNEQVKINKWDGAAVKTALDDAVKEVLIKKYNYIQNFTLMDVRLAISGIAVAVAGSALSWDYIYPFPASRNILVFGVAVYFILITILNLHTTYKEKGIFAVAVHRDSAGFDPDYRWEVSSGLKKYDDKYNLIMSVKNEATGQVNETQVTTSIANFIDVNGVIIPKLIEAMVSDLHDSLIAQKKDK